MNLTVRPETASDHEVIRHVNRLAFGRDEEAGIVDALRACGYARVSLVAEVENTVVGHILFSDLPILSTDGTVSALALAPMAIRPEYQRQGIGTALVRHGMDVCRDQGHRIVVVLVHPHFYPRFGFSAKLAEPLSSPFSGRESWMALELVPGALNGIAGWVRYSPPFGIEPHVRPVYKADHADWLRMRRMLWPDEPDNDHAAEVAAFFATDSFRWSESLLVFAVFVAVRPAGGLCGFLEASVRPYVDGCETRPVGYVEGWFVDADMRRQGIGKKLVTASERWAAAQGCEEMASDAHLENTVSHNSHKALGFEESSRLVHFRKRLTEVNEKAVGRFGTIRRLTLFVQEGTFAVCRLAPNAPTPPWATSGPFVSVTRTADELSVVCRQEAVPDEVQCERGWRCLRVAGTLPFTAVGVLVSLTAPVAAAGIGLFAVSTYDTDFLLVKQEEWSAAVDALRLAGHVVN
jgi:predicted N-acetyltransferase YhbS